MRFSRWTSKVITRLPRCLKTFAIILIIVFILQSIIFNTVILYVIWHAGSVISNIIHAPGSTFMDKLAVDPAFQQLVYSGKNGGFKSLIEQTLGRLYFVENSCRNLQGNSYKKSKCDIDYPSIYSVGIDVSSSGEVMYIYKRMQKHTNKPWTRLIVDIGANDGLMSSNSFNFIQLGWSAILVEPQASQLNMASRNLHGIAKDPDQTIDLVQAVLGDRDGKVHFQLSNDIVSMESHIVANHHHLGNKLNMIQVDSYTVRSFVRKYNVPKQFGILSIDAEGTGSKILHQWIALGFRPAYIIYEALHDPENIQETSLKLEQAGYTFLVKLGWNSIYEFDISRYNSSSTNV